MRPLSTPALLAHLAFVLVGLAVLLTACGDAPERLDAASEPASDAMVVPVSDPSAESALVAEAVQVDAEAGQAPSAEPVIPSMEPSPSPSPEVISAPLPEREPMRAPEPVPPPAAPPAQEPTPEPRNTAAADAFWEAFQHAVRSRDQAAIAQGLADEVRVGDQTFAKTSQEVQAVLEAIVEEDAAREAYLAVDRLTHSSEASTFETTAHYTVEGEDYEVVVFGTVEEVAPGDWRLVEVGSR
ncbi:MAG: hypothetical protein AAGI52_00645 [Bacteroidota bacterium]